MLKRLGMFLLLVLFSSRFYGHYAQTATFTFFIENQKLKVLMEFDESHLLDYFSDDQLNKNKLMQYIQKNLMCKVNGSKTAYTITSIHKNSHHIQVMAIFDFNPSHKIQYFFVTNTCLLDYHSEHINSINLDLNGKYRGFKIDSKRKNVRAEY